MKSKRNKEEGLSKETQRTIILLLPNHKKQRTPNHKL